MLSSAVGSDHGERITSGLTRRPLQFCLRTCICASVLTDTFFLRKEENFHILMPEGKKVIIIKKKIMIKNK